ncbi:MAG: VWA domain-containing protein [Pseudomonadales bacterium]|nr:VWA domain-containing protein [Pseudomonadales bacterium]
MNLRHAVVLGLCANLLLACSSDENSDTDNKVQTSAVEPITQAQKQSKPKPKPKEKSKPKEKARPMKREAAKKMAKRDISQVKDQLAGLRSAFRPVSANKSLAKGGSSGTVVTRSQITGKATATAGGIKTAAMLQNMQPDREQYARVEQNTIKQVLNEPVSTFSIDVDTASYANVRRILNQGRLPPHDAVRIEELINYFNYDYPLPKNKPFSVSTEIARSPWKPGKLLLNIGIQGDKQVLDKRAPTNLVFLIDVSGSMHSENKLGLLKNAFRLLVAQLNAQDRVAIVVYAGASGVVLESTWGNKQATINAALDQLRAGGSTNGGAGIQAAYNQAQLGFIKGGVNRVILATDGDFNVGTSSQQALKRLIEEKRESGISLSILGFGRGNYNDALMQTLAQNGNGNAYYIDNLNEARKVLVDDLAATLYTIAKDVKIQIEFNPELVSEYRLVGYETRALKREDFNNDKVDAGDIGAGHTVTAIYELSLRGSKSNAIEPLRYASNQPVAAGKHNGELAFLRLRYKQPDASSSELLEYPILQSSIKRDFSTVSNNFKFSTAVASFGQILKGGDYSGDVTLTDVIKLAQQSKGYDENGYRGEFIGIAKLAESLQKAQRSSTNSRSATDSGRYPKANIAVESDIHSVLNRNQGSLYNLYSRALRKNPVLAGKVQFDIDIAADGSVAMCRILSSELNDAKLERRLLSKMKTIKFSAASVASRKTRWSVDFKVI